MLFWICPVCGAPLTREFACWKCASRHSFDTAKSGYVNLLPPNAKHSKQPGDNAEMIAARRNFLNRGYYEKLSDALNELCRKVTPPNGVVLDAGCGDGYYTARLQNGTGFTCFGTDISKSALERAAKRCKSVQFAVAGSFHLPVANASCDTVVTVFAPPAGAEFGRVLKKGGHYVSVTAGAKHLAELKELMYEVPYDNPEKEPEYAGFVCAERERLSYRVLLETREDVENLFCMTPYRYKTDAAGAQKLKELSRLEITCDFMLTVYRKIAAK